MTGAPLELCNAAILINGPEGYKDGGSYIERDGKSFFCMENSIQGHRKAAKKLIRS